MGFRLPGTDLFCLGYDRLEPELFERILFPSISWSEICKSYEFYDGPANGLFIVNIRPRQNGSRIQNSGGERDKQKLKQMVFSGDVVMLNKGYSPAGLFFIDAQGELQCRNTGVFSQGGADRVIRSYQRSVSRSDYSRNGNKPRPTPDRYLRPGGWQEDNPLNSQFGGSWLAAAGMYHHQQEAFSEIARRAGPEAERGYSRIAGSTSVKVAVAAGAIMGVQKASYGARSSGITLTEKAKLSSVMVRPINGRLPLNSRFAGKVFPASDLPREIRHKYPHGVPFTHAGFPDFARYSIKNVRITPGKNRGQDFARADKIAGYSRSNPRPDGYTWHHNRETGFMQLVPAELHSAVRHTGGIAKGK